MEILSVNQAKNIDKVTIEETGVPSIVLMENAGNEIALNIYDKGNSFLVCCSIGNNGGDGLVIARKLMLKGKNVKIIILGNAEKGTTDFLINYRILINMKADILQVQTIDSKFSDYINNADLIIDCIFGIGLNRSVEGIYYDAIKTINDNARYVIAVDIPSGLDADTGKVRNIAVKADETYTVEVYKKGFLSYDALEVLGKISVIKIGVLQETIENNSNNITFINKDEVVRNLPKRKLWGHKGDYGKVLILAGSEEYTGAPYLTCEAAVKTGSGLVSLLINDEVKGILAQKLTEAMVVGYKEKEKIDKLIKEADVIACGPGLGKKENNIEMLKYILKNSTCILVMDADALNILSINEELFSYIKDRTVITPHSGEMARLTGQDIKYINDNRLDVCVTFSKRYKITTLLKGYNTIISNGSLTKINDTGNSKMSSGGMGDTLTGIIASLIGQGMDVFSATQLAANIHGAIGDYLAKDNYCIDAQMIISEIPHFMNKYLNK